jgi:hypothetical protein
MRRGPGAREADRLAGGIDIRVASYAGYRADERPLSFVLGERALVVREVLDRWYGPNRRFFKVSADDGNIYILAHDEQADRWELVSYRKSSDDKFF